MFLYFNEKQSELIAENMFLYFIFKPLYVYFYFAVNISVALFSSLYFNVALNTLMLAYDWQVNISRKRDSTKRFSKR